MLTAAEIFLNAEFYADHPHLKTAIDNPSSFTTDLEANAMLFWENVMKLKDDLGLNVSEPKLPRKRKVSQRLQIGTGAAYFPDNVEEMYRAIYFEGCDTVVITIKDRFQQKDYEMYSMCEQLLLKGCRGDSIEEEIEDVCDFYKLNLHQLRAQLRIFSTNFVGKSCADTLTLSETVAITKSKSKYEKELVDQVVGLMKLILVMPATNAGSERAFSVMKPLKTYLRSTIS